MNNNFEIAVNEDNKLLDDGYYFDDSENLDDFDYEAEFYD